MSDSSTYSRGDSFEIKTFELFKKLLDNDDFYVSGKRSKIFRKKGYYSEKRKSEIIFDIAIETYLNNTSNYALLTLIECKNYQSSVPVNDLEEFDSKIRQISEHNTKGILITNSTFQSGSYNFAQSAGIGLARVNSDDEFEWLVHRKANNDALLKKSDAIILLENDTDSRPNFLAVNGDFVLQTLSELLIQSQVIDFFTYKEKFINIPFITAQKIDNIVQKLEGYDVFHGKMLDEIKLCRFLETKYPVTFDFETTLPDNILGKITFSPLKIQVSKSLKPDINRWRFTLAHEIGHLILHSKLLQEKVTEKTDTDYSLSFKYSVSEATTKRLEYQANLFASHLLLPINTLIKDVAAYFAKENIHKRALYWDNQPVNQNLVFNLLTRLSTLYGVSVEVVRIRLIALGLLIDNRYKSIRDVLKEMRYM
jgi:Zn-dependent peptidase ImmA (M78 family)